MIMPTIELSASDTTRQKRVRLRGIPTDQAVGELLDHEILPRLALPRLDSQQRPIAWSARLSRTGQYVNRSERVSDALLDQDEVVLQPNIDAG